MTREEAIEALKIDIHNAKVARHQFEQYDMAIQALEQTELKSSYNSIKTELNDDAISRQAAIDAIEKTKSAMTTDGEIYVAKINAEMNIQQLPSVSTEKTGRWIPVSERLPEEDCETYLVCCANGYIASIMYGRYLGWLLDDDIVAWMPLPEPYKAESEEV